MTATGALTIIHSFSGPDGSSPYAPLVEAPDGSFYGTAMTGGASGFGIVFNIQVDSTLRVVHSFQGGDSSPGGQGKEAGGFPQTSVLQLSDGTLWGSTSMVSTAGGLSQAPSTTSLPTGRQSAGGLSASTALRSRRP